jgi:hypothetical protein
VRNYTLVANRGDNRVSLAEEINQLVGKRLMSRQGGKQESRWVYDRTLGNSVCWVDRWDRDHVTPWVEFQDWMKQKNAKIVR